MDTRTFVVELIKPLAWPVTLLLVLLVMRKPVTDLILVVQKLRFRDLELEFGQKVDALTVQASAELPSGRKPFQSVVLPDKFLRLAEASPRSAVLEAWVEVERAIREAAGRHELTPSRTGADSPMELLRALAQKGIVDKTKVDLANGARMVRNDAVHTPDFVFGVNAALNYADIARGIVEYLKHV